MKTTSRDSWQDRDDATADAPEQPNAGSRRLLLGGAAAGLTLAASGLYLPNGLGETAAREGALGGANGGRHGENRRGRDKQRSHGDRKHKKNKRKGQDKPRGFISGIEFLVTVYPGGRPVQIGHWVIGDNEHQLRLKEVRTIKPGAAIASFDDSTDKGNLGIDGHFELYVDNVSPVGYPSVELYDRETTIRDCCKALAEGEKALLKSSGWEIELVRFDDTFLRKHYRVLIRTPPA